jgi:hypothetical protein
MTILDLEQRVGAQWSHIRTARTSSDGQLALLRSRVKGLGLGEELSVVCYGSVARKEVTPKSDVDWTLLVDGPASPDHFETMRKVAQKLVPDDKKPGREAVFGTLCFSHELVHLIGGQDDTNRNTTRRVLLLLESISLGKEGTVLDAYCRVVRSVLNRYVGEDEGFVGKRRSAMHVPRFLLNDIARYWRTMCVDFAYKARTRGGEGAALRNLKLRMSRKLLFVSGLLNCLGCELGTAPMLTSGECQGKTRESAERDPLECVSCLEQAVQRPALDVLARTAMVVGSAGAEAPLVAARKVCDAYNAFLGILTDQGQRTELGGSSSFDGHAFKHGRTLSHDFADGLQQFFFQSDEKLTRLTQLYGVF